ncbi:MAG: PspC domain-containing protein [Alkalibacterium sp.]|uniref:Phage shock protein C (PspC) family protein n=1 Tax=Alkalibacterium gilvum TaxID=1130080 RepID=A0A1H6SQN0_9LACT|nr:MULTISPECIES: PspC domain-containing protein [Alkalibacterium]MDN6193816.1 PspC domain-containing protein [Alkalibacterium sp.]MDN6293022.1 PspC domain-containing protein [Alkalibacterium sp.]MDN6294957.1 PspC domain-containing protein [Alkalibacterium sp.]MDN6327533.1 PspC domain-containing protein [Alkalibacterium sp.]MDN6385283.1 PspC domain-containing protein [Alkalibacterium sp.]
MKKLTKSKNNEVIFGVIGGLGEYFNIDPVLLRVVVVVLTFIGVGSTVPIYLLLALVMPDGEQVSRPTNKGRSPFGQYNGKTKRKEAEKVEEDDWSDF